MLDLKLIRENPDFVEAQLARRNGGFSIQELKAVDIRQREAQAELEQLNRRKNEISELFKTGKASKEEVETLRAETKEIKARSEIVHPLVKELDEERERLSMAIPNLPEKSVPDGADEEGNQLISTWGTIPDIKNAKHHYEIGTELAIFDFERGVKISQSRFTVLMHWGARLERALMNFMLDSHAKRGYSEVFPPILVNRDCLVGTGQLPKFAGDYYKIDEAMVAFSLPSIEPSNLLRVSPCPAT